LGDKGNKVVNCQRAPVEMFYGRPDGVGGEKTPEKDLSLLEQSYTGKSGGKTDSEAREKWAL